MHLDRTYLLLSVFALLMAMSGAACAAAGVFQFAAGDVRLVNPSGVERTARKGEALNEGDTILTGRDGVAQIKMADGGFISVRANTRMKVDTYTYTGKQDGSEKSFFSLLAGGFRALTGLIGKLNKDNYKITTPTATIGIRGTDHEPMVILPGQSALGEPGTYDKVNSGASFIATVKGVINVNPNQVGFAPGANVAPVILPKIPAFYKESPPVPVEETRRLEKEHGAAREEGKGMEAAKAVDKMPGKEEEGGVPEAGKRTAETRKGTQPGDAAAGQPPELDKAAPGSALLPARKPASLASPDDLPDDAGTAGAKTVAPRTPVIPGKALPAPLPGKADAPAVPTGTTPLLAPLPTISTTTKLAPLTTTTQPLTAPTTTTTKTLDPLVAPATTSGTTTTTTTTTTRTLDPALTTTTTTIKTLDPALTTTIQPILTAPTTTTTTTTTTSPTLTSPTLTSPLLSPTTTTIKTLP